MSDDVPVGVLCEQRERAVAGDLVAQRVHKIGHDLPVVAERRQVQPANSRAVRPLLHAKVHQRTVEPAGGLPVNLRLARRSRGWVEACRRSAEDGPRDH